MRILSHHGNALLHDHMVTYRLFVVNFSNRDDPFFLSKQRHVPHQTPDDAIQRCVWSVVEDVAKIYMTCDSRNDFYMLQCVKASWAVAKFVGYMPTLAAKQEMLLLFVRCVLAMYVARGRPVTATGGPSSTVDDADPIDDVDKAKLPATEGEKSLLGHVLLPLRLD